MTDLIVTAARFLAEHLEWMRHRPEADEFLRDVQACARVVAGVARGPAAQRYLGPCGAVLAETAEPCPGDCSCRSGLRTALSDACTACSCFTSCHPTVETEAEGEVCTGDIYAREGASAGRCRTCGAQVSTDARRTWLDAEVRSRAFRAAEIAAAYGINVKTIRSWATDRPARYDHSGTQTQAPRPAKLRSYWRTEAGLTVEWVDPVLDPKLKGEELKARLGEISDEIQARGGRLHYIGEVLDLAAADAARREEARADRARRATAREAVEMGA